MADSVFNPLPLLSLFDRAEVANSIDLSLHFVVSFLFLVAIENCTFSFGVLNTANRLFSLSFSHLAVGSI